MQLPPVQPRPGDRRRNRDAGCGVRRRDARERHQHSKPERGDDNPDGEATDHQLTPFRQAPGSASGVRAAAAIRLAAPALLLVQQPTVPLASRWSALTLDVLRSLCSTLAHVASRQDAARRLANRSPSRPGSDSVFRWSQPPAPRSASRAHIAYRPPRRTSIMCAAWAALLPSPVHRAYGPHRWIVGSRAGCGCSDVRTVELLRHPESPLKPSSSRRGPASTRFGSEPTRTLWSGGTACASSWTSTIPAASAARSCVRSESVRRASRRSRVGQEARSHSIKKRRPESPATAL